jgi:hypothetical protein
MVQFSQGFEGLVDSFLGLGDHERVWLQKGELLQPVFFDEDPIAEDIKAREGGRGCR